MSKNVIRLALETSVGMLCYMLLLGILGWLLHGSLGFVLPPVLLGLAADFMSDVLVLVHMAYITERVADSMDEAYANKTTIIHAMIRKVVFIIVLVYLGIRPQINPVAMILGALGLKAGAFLQPFVHRAFSHGAVTH